jgi:branched-subunit amino acid ABC-type transport system permease component
MFNQLLLNGIIAGSIYALIALGFAVIYKTVRFFHFAHGIVYTAGAYFAYSFSISLGIKSKIRGVKSLLMTKLKNEICKDIAFVFAHRRGEL